MSPGIPSDGAARAQSVAKSAAVVGCIASLLLFLVVSHKSPPVLIVLIGGWVLAPFIGFFVADRFIRPDAALQGMMLLIVIISLAVYSYAAFGSPTWKPAAPFVAVPLLSWALLAIASVFAMLRPKSSRANDG